MARTSPVHYIAPSAISITSNANNSPSDLAVYVAKGARIKVYSEGVADLGMVNATWQEWTLRGRNRRLNDATVPYTIYARLKKADKADGYLIFAGKEQDGDKWKDKYAYVTMEGLAEGTADRNDDAYWYIKLGEVGIPGADGRAVDLDTGILGTDQYNQEWSRDPDSLTLRVELACRIDDEDAGQTPYVPWDKSLTLDARLVRGWGTDAADAVDHWTIARSTGNTEADAAWPGTERADSFGQTGSIMLSHARGSGDDFAGAVAAVFTVTAWGLKEPAGSGDPSAETEYTALAAAAITILPEAGEAYAMELSDTVVSYDPKEDTYSPSGGVTVRIRAKAQDGSVSYLEQALIEAALLHVYYLPVGEEEGEDAPPELTFADGTATLPISVFHAGKSISLWLENEAQVVMDRATVGYVRHGEDGENGEDGDETYSVELTKSSDSATIDPSGNVVGGYRTVSKDSSGNEFYTYRFHTSVTVMKGEEYLHLCGALDDEEELGDGNFTVEAIGAGCELEVKGTTVYITYIWHCNDGDAGTDPYTSYNRTPEDYQLMRAMTEAVAHITLNIEGRTSVTKDYRLQLVHLPTDTITIESHNEIAAVNWSTKKNAWTNRQDIVIPLTASSGGQPVMFQTVNGGTDPDIRLIDQPGWLSGTPGFSVAWADYDEDGDGQAEYTAAQHMSVEITIPIANILRTWQDNGTAQQIGTTNLLKFNVTTVVDGVEYENVVPFTLNVTTDKAIYILVPSTKQVVGTMIGGSWDPATKTISNARYSYMAANVACNKVTCRLMSYDQNDQLTEITSASDIHDNLTFFINGAASTLDGFRTTGVQNTAVAGRNHNLFDELSEIVFAIKIDGRDYESEGVPILRNGANLSIGSNGNWFIGGVDTGVFAKGTEVTDTFIYYTEPMTDSTPPVYAPTASQRGNPVAPYTRTICPASVEGKFIHYVSITVFSDSEETYVYSYGTIGTGNTITVIHDRDFYATPTTKTDAQLAALPNSSWSESTPADYSATNKYLYSRDTARYYKNGAEQTVTVGGITYPKVVYTLLSYWGQDGSGVEFAFYRAADDSAANKPTADVLNQRHAGTAKNPVIPDWSGADGGWYDDNPGFTAHGQVMYQSINKYMGGTWSGWSSPVIIDRYAKNGDQGPQGIYEEKQYGRSSSSTSYGSGYIDSSYGWQSEIPATSVYYPFIWQRTRTYNPANGSYSNWTYARLTGEPGSEGRKGLWYAYAGVWGTDVTPSVGVTNTSTQGWYVKYGDKWYMNVMAAGSANTNTPGGSGWEEMKSEFKYYIARVYFGDYAHLGSFIINGDWMISQYGTVNGSFSTNYSAFDPSNPNNNTGSNFIPNFAVDGLTGKTYQNDAYIKGKIVATSGNITGMLTVGTYGSGVNSIRIEPSDTTPSIVGYQGTTEVLRLSSRMYYDGTYAASLRLGDSIFRNNGIWINNNGANGRLTTGQVTVEQFENGHHYPVWLKVMNKKIRFGANGASMWPTSRADVSEGEVYLDGDTLKVAMPY